MAALRESGVHKVVSEHERGVHKSGCGKQLRDCKQAMTIAMPESAPSRRRKRAS